MKKFLAVAGILVCVPGFSQAEFHTNSPTKAIEEVSQRLYNHYEVDDTINGYVMNKIKYGVSIVGPSETKSDTNTSKFPQRKKFKQKVVLKSKNKMYWKFQPNHMFIVNPSSPKGLTYSWNNVGFIAIKQDEASVGITYKW